MVFFVLRWFREAEGGALNTPSKIQKRPFAADFDSIIRRFKKVEIRLRSSNHLRLPKVRGRFFPDRGKTVSVYLHRDGFVTLNCLRTCAS